MVEGTKRAFEAHASLYEVCGRTAHYRRDAVVQDVNPGHRLGDREDEHADDHRHIGPRHGREVLAGPDIEPAYEVGAGAFDHVYAAGLDTLCEPAPFDECGNGPSAVEPEHRIEDIHPAAPSRKKAHEHGEEPEDQHHSVGGQAQAAEVQRDRRG